MKKMKQGIKASRAVIMMMMMMVLVQAHNNVSINAAKDKENMINGTNNKYFGNIENDDEVVLFPDAISSEMHRRVLQQGGGTKTGGTSDANNPAFNSVGNRYAQDYNGPSPQNPNGASGCRDPYFRAC